MDNVWIVAQAGEIGGRSEVSAEPVKESKPVTVVDSNASGKPAPANTPPMYYQWILIVVIFLVMYLILFREPRKRQKQQQQMMQSLKKNDKVRTIGGIIGTVVDVKDDQVLLKVDESNNTKIWFVASAIGKNLSSGGK
jgi:preprotein translocase subunit YajC